MTATAALNSTAVASNRRREINPWLLDMDGVLLHESHAVAGADRFSLDCASRAHRSWC
jgi:hypothetical protein